MAHAFVSSRRLTAQLLAITREMGERKVPVIATNLQPFAHVDGAIDKFPKSLTLLTKTRLDAVHSFIYNMSVNCESRRMISLDVCL